MKLFYKRAVSVLLAAVIMLGFIPSKAFAAEAESVSATNKFAGKTVSILGDSISTFGGVSKDTSSNSTIGSNAAYYTGQGGVMRADTWWQQCIDALDMTLLVNNSWSGSCVFQPRKGEASVGYTDRCVNLHNDHTGEEPDIILIFLGTNDLKNYPQTLGIEAEIDYDAIICKNDDGTYTYATATTTCEAYAIMLHKMSVRYPYAEIYCMNLLPRKVGHTQPTSFNADIAKIATRFDCAVIDIENCGIGTDAASMSEYMYDGSVHPNQKGMDLMTQAVVSALTGETTVIRNIELTLKNVESDNNTHAFIDGQPFYANLTAINPQEDISVTVTMGGEDITASCWNGRKITIPCVTDNISITATSDRGDLSFHWKFQSGDLVNIVSDSAAPNMLTKIRGTSENGVFSDTYYRTQHTVELMHDHNWVIEWKGSGNGGFMLSDATSAAASSMYFRRHTTRLLHVFGVYEDGKYHHYGIKPTDYGINASEQHIYRMENRIFEDGSNMIYLFVDGVELGAMNHYYIGYADQGTTDDWVSGKDFYINYVGSSSHPLTNYSMEYLTVWEDYHTHTYSDGICTACGLLKADFNDDKALDTDDAIYLLRHVLLPDSYPTEQDTDVNSDGNTDTDDAIYLLRHVLLPEQYPFK